jgi:hypothetical protein
MKDCVPWRWMGYTTVSPSHKQHTGLNYLMKICNPRDKNKRNETCTVNGWINRYKIIPLSACQYRLPENIRIAQLRVQNTSLRAWNSFTFFRLVP